MRTPTGQPRADTPGREGASRRWPRLLDAFAVFVVVVGVLVQVVRPVAPRVVPAPASEWFSDAYLARADAYRDPIYAALLLALAVRIGVAAAVALTPLGRRAVATVLAAVGEHRATLAATCVVLGVVVLTDVLLLPLAFWVGFVHEGAYGFRTQGIAGWGRDWLLAVLPVWLGIAALTAAGYALARKLPRTWPAVGGLTAGALSIVVVFAAPLVLEPLMFRLTPLPDGPARDEVERVLARAGEDVEAILVADASRRTTKPNAYVSGVGSTRRLVLHDTLLAQHPPDEVGLVLAHELAHQRHGDLERGGLFAAAGSVVAAAVLALVLRARTRAGAQRNVTDPRAGAVVVLVALLLNTASLPVESWVSRRAEAAADAGSLSLTGDPDAYLRMHERLARASLSDPAPPVWAYVLWFSHPTITTRLALGAAWAR